jgi:bacterial leucyl aminopeptidase
MNIAVKILAYAAEESGLIGSDEIAADFRQRDASSLGALQRDITNYKASECDIYLPEDGAVVSRNPFLRKLIAAYIPGLIVDAELDHR